ncbi:MAG: acyltransferase, partial [Paramuribaculum sp.]|nr:acyltransferase [Paramuribaculum sp.]
KLSLLVKDPGFAHAVRYVMPEVDFSDFVNKLLAIPDKATFQNKIMWPFLEMLAKKTTAGISVGGMGNVDTDKSFTFISNHRDIVLDASFLNLCFLRAGLPTSEVAIGDNLLIYDWITDLVKLNKSFVVRRNLKLTKALEAAKELSAYMHHAITDKHESIWIAQREGRAKDSNDLTQESLVKMMALGGSGSLLENIAELNLVPVSISYEYDPNDGLKAKEFLMKRNDPDFKKSPHDDLLSMETGMLQFKGRVHFEIGKCISDEVRAIPADVDRVEAVRRICSIIDKSIHTGYKIYPINYVAADLLEGSTELGDKYTAADMSDLEDHINSKIDSADIPGLSDDDRGYMRRMILSMYANPLKNKLAAAD